MSTNLKTAISSKIDRFHTFLPIATEKKKPKDFYE